MCRCPDGFELSSDLKTCECASGLHLSADGKSCESSDPCSIANGGCSQICNVHDNLIVCSCRNGFEIDAKDKTQCSDVNECEAKHT